MTPEEEIIKLLTDLQARQRLSGVEMAKLLGIAPSSWNQFRRRKRDIPRIGILSGFAKLFPRRMGLLREFLTGSEADDSAA